MELRRTSGSIAAEGRRVPAAVSRGPGPVALPPDPAAGGRARLLGAVPGGKRPERHSLLRGRFTLPGPGRRSDRLAALSPAVDSGRGERGPADAPAPHPDKPLPGQRPAAPTTCRAMIEIEVD